MTGVSDQRPDVEAVELWQGRVAVGGHIVTIRFQGSYVSHEQEVDRLGDRLLKDLESLTQSATGYDISVRPPPIFYSAGKVALEAVVEKNDIELLRYLHDRPGVDDRIILKHHQILTNFL